MKRPLCMNPKRADRKVPMCTLFSKKLLSTRMKAERSAPAAPRRAARARDLNEEIGQLTPSEYEKFTKFKKLLKIKEERR
jgi:hypothetical protein